jgi:hypothetical protein
MVTRRICAELYCEELFSPRTTHHTYCSAACKGRERQRRNYRKRQLEDRRCEIPGCNNPLPARPGPGRPIKYCSPECRDIGYRYPSPPSLHERICANENCSTPFLTNDPSSCCSDACRREAVRAWRAKNFRRKYHSDPEWRANRLSSRERSSKLIRRKAQAYDILFNAVAPWWTEVKKALQDRTEIPAPPEYTEIEEVA